MPRAAEVNRDELTPFAQALLDWMWDQRPSWPRSKLAHALGVARGTVDSWFRSTKGRAKPTLPTGAAVHAVMRVTGWTPERMMELTGYRELPPPGEREFIMDWFANAYQEFDANERHRIRDALGRAYAAYDDLSRVRPPRRQTAPRLRQGGATVGRPAEASEPRTRQRTPVGSGK